MCWKRLYCIAALVLGTATALAQQDSLSLSDPIPEFQDDPSVDLPNLADIPVREELNATVTTVSRQESTVARSPAAVFVLTKEKIKRSGARTIPDALRLVPGLHVARLDGNKWSVSARGFSGRHARKLQVQIDGRSVYTPVFSGVYWDVADVMLADIERIEVIRGPGSTVWGANAMNGIINIITKKASETQGVYVEGGGGTEERGFAGVRVGSTTANGISWRVSSNWFERDRQASNQITPNDDWRQGRVGFRADWDATACDTFTVQGDAYEGRSGDSNRYPLIGLQQFDVPVSGAYALARWKHSIEEDNSWTFQVFYDRRNRRILDFDAEVNILDFDFQHQFLFQDYHNVIWGLGHKRVSDQITSSPGVSPLAMDPTERTTDLVSAFIQDEITLLQDRLYFTIGTKISDNYYTDFEVQPSARLLFLPDQQTATWAAISRSARLPSRIEHDGRVLIGEAAGQPITMSGTPGLDSETLLAYEIGVRQAPNEFLFWDATIFYHDYQDGITFQRTNPAGFPPAFHVINGLNGYTTGVEFTSTAQLTENWSLFTSYTFLNMHLGTVPQAAISGSASDEANPRNLLTLMSSWDVGCFYEFDLIARYVDEIPSLNVPSYFTMDARLACRLYENMELSLVGQNLLDSKQLEYGTSIFTHEVATEVQRGVYGMVRVDY